MNKDYLKDIYKDFFDTENLPKIEVKEMPNDEKMASLFDRIKALNVSDESKELIKRIVEYMRLFKEGTETNYIPFRIILDTNNKLLEEEITDILETAGSFYNYIDSGKKEISLYKIENIDNPGMLLINNINGINLEETKTFKKFVHDLTEFLDKDSKCITVISGTSEEINNFFLGNESLKNNYFDFSIKGTNPDIQDIYNDVLDKVSIDDDLKVKVLDYITATYNKDIDYVEYKNDLIKYISFNKDVPKVEEEKTIDEVFADLNELVGLTKVKKVLHELVDVISLKEKASDLKIKDINLHMVFLGNPGTGKTTIARMISEILYNLKYVKENKLVEVSVKDLVAEYVGQTAPKTMSVIEKAMNGVLFIDEAYALADRGDNSYNGEAIATLIQAMENYRDKLVVIFAGYTKEMRAFLDSNSGITSRIGYTLHFDDYTTDELIEIFLGMTKKAGFEVEEDAIDYLREIIEKYRNMKNFGNARFIRNIFEKTVVRHASNVKNKKQKKILKTITKNDINIENLILE